MRVAGKQADGQRAEGRSNGIDWDGLDKERQVKVGI